jgi:hypothetical protein
MPLKRQARWGKRRALWVESVPLGFATERAKIEMIQCPYGGRLRLSISVPEVGNQCPGRRWRVLSAENVEVISGKIDYLHAAQG